MGAGANYPTPAFRYASSLNPTNNVLPTRTVGARRFPVGPRIAFNSSASLGGFFMSNVTVDLPLATMTFAADFASLSASARPSRTFFASTTSAGSILFFARNPCDRPHEVHPLR